MKHRSICLPQDCWEHLEAEAARLKLSISGAAAHMVRSNRDDRLLARIELLERHVAQMRERIIDEPEPDGYYSSFRR